VIGDDLNAFIKTSKEKGSVPAEFDVPFAHTPAFVGSHVTGYDNALLGVLQHFWDGKSKTTEPLVRVPNDSINFIGGFDGFVVGNMKEVRHIFAAFGVPVNILCDPSEVWNTRPPTASSACTRAAPPRPRSRRRCMPRRPSSSRSSAARRPPSTCARRARRWWC
jgi:hypothetical protein